MDSAIKRLTDRFREIIEGISEINTFKVGYIDELSTGISEYDALLLLPPKSVIQTPRVWNSRDYDIKYTLMKLNKGATGGEMTEAERIAAWGSLDSINRTIIEGLMENPSEFQIIGSIGVDYGEAVNILPDKVVWINVTFKLKAHDC